MRLACMVPSTSRPLTAHYCPSPPFLFIFSLLKLKVLVDSGEPKDDNYIVIKGCPLIGAEEAEMG